VPRLCRTPVRNESPQFMREWSSNRSRSSAASVCQRRSVRQSLTALQRRVRPFAWQRFAVRVDSSSSSNQCCLWDAGVILRNMSAYENKGDHEHPFVLPRTTYKLSICGTLSLLSYEVAERGGGVGKQRGGALEANCCANS